MSQPRFVHPEGVSFTCTRCGDCCRGWNVMLGPGEPERLTALSWEGREPDLVGERPWVELKLPSGARRKSLRRRDDGACVFLGADNQCLLHQHFGAEAKPLMCRMFPFGFLPVADRLAVDVSFYCRAVSEGRGAPVKERIPEWARLCHQRPKGETRHRFSSRYSVSGSLLWELEHHLLDFLSDRAFTLLERVRLVSEFVRLTTTSDPTTEAARTVRQAMARGLPGQIRERPAEGTMDDTQRTVFFHLIFLHLNPTPPELQAMKGKAKARAVQKRVEAASGFEQPEKRPWIDNRELGITYRDVGETGSGYLASEAGERLCERYLGAKIVGQRFRREGERELDFIEAVSRLLLLFPMLGWTAKALAAERGEKRVGEADARRAVRLIDRSYGEIRLRDLPPKQLKAWQFVLTETDLPVAAALDVLGS